MPEQPNSSGRLYAASAETGLFQKELGKKIGLRQATISRLEAGEPATQVRTLLDVLVAMGLEIIIDKRDESPGNDIEDCPVMGLDQRGDVVRFYCTSKFSVGCVGIYPLAENKISGLLRQYAEYLRVKIPELFEDAGRAIEKHAELQNNKPFAPKWFLCILTSPSEPTTVYPIAVKPFHSSRNRYRHPMAG